MVNFNTDDDDTYLALGPMRDEMLNAGAEILKDNIGDCVMARQIVKEIYWAMRKIELSQPGDD